MFSTLTLSMLGLVGMSLAAGNNTCNPNNCYRSFNDDSVSLIAQSFCSGFTIATFTAMTDLPAYAIRACSTSIPEQISSICSCAYPARIAATPTITPSTTTRSGCHEDNCLRAMVREGGIGARPFCTSFTAGIITNTAALPTYASMCSPDPVLGISSACSCLRLNATSTSISSSEFSPTPSLTPSPTSSPVQPDIVVPHPCNEDNCLRAMMREGSVDATPFCNQFTTATITDIAALPTYASMCNPHAIAGISSACSCYVHPTITSVVSKFEGCHEDNCFRALVREGGVEATQFCSQFTVSVVTSPAALPTYASMCTGDPYHGISSACSCLH